MGEGGVDRESGGGGGGVGGSDSRQQRVKMPVDWAGCGFCANQPLHFYTVIIFVFSASEMTLTILCIAQCLTLTSSPVGDIFR